MFTVKESVKDLAPFANVANKWGAIAFIALPLLFVWWRIYAGVATFAVVHAPGGGTFISPEMWVAYVTGAYLLTLNVFRLLTVLLTIDRQRGVKEPAITSFMQKYGSLYALLSYSVTYLFWALIMHPGPNAMHAPMLVLLAFMSASFVIAWKRYVYGFKLDGSSEAIQKGYVQPTARATTDGEYDVTEVRRPHITFADIIGNAQIKGRVLKAAQKVRDSAGENSARNGILLHGAPGNGKTIFAEALAGELNLPLISLTYAEVVSKWAGERTSRIRAAFEMAKNNQPCVLFIDEIDSFIPDRGTVNSFVKEDMDSINAMLTLLVDIRKHNVVVIAATNFMERLDPAAVREGRFDFKVEITAPDAEARIGILLNGLKTNLPKVLVDDSTVKMVAERWNGYSVKRILAVTEELASYVEEAADDGRKIKALTYDEFQEALRKVQGSKGVKPESVKEMSALVLAPVTKSALDLIAGRLRDPVRVERLGGTLPTGVLFYGPAGTGKTSAAKSLAKAVDAAFLVATGPDLVRNPAELDKLYARAMEMRPAIIFIDEADDLLKAREMSPNTEATNKLLTIMDGVSDKVRDIVWIAATNHPDLIDAALMRGGRFTEKVEFLVPSEDQRVVHIRSWLQSRKVALGSGLTYEGMSDMLGDQSVANVEAVLQYAVNSAIAATTGDSIEISLQDVEAAITVILG